MNQPTVPEKLVPGHIRAARALVGWSQKELAKAAGIATSTVADFERGRRTPTARNTQAIREALQQAGIRLLPTGAVMDTPKAASGPDRTDRALPVRWINSDDLSEWANRADAAHTMPELLSMLIRATHGTAVRLRFPSDSGVRHAGWDGHTDADHGSAYVPAGTAGWEIGTQRTNIRQKATDDYQKRTQDPAPLDPPDSTYIFVTPRRWPDKDKWAQELQQKGPWKEVRAFDVEDLVHWIELAPAAGLHLARQFGKRPDGIRELEEVWEEWSLATQWPLTDELTLCDRNEEADEIQRWLRGDPSVLSLQASTTSEVIAFFHATISSLPDEEAARYRARALVATTTTAARALADASGPLILVLSEPNPGLANSLAGQGHYVLQAYDDRPLARGQARKLSRPSREGIAKALIAAGIAEPRAYGLARESARSLAVLRRLIPGAPEHFPAWAQDPPPPALLAAVLAGGWDEDSEADKARLSELANQPYEAITAALAPHVGDLDKPLRKIGTTWRVASPQDAWFLLAQHLTDAHVARFEAAALAVLGSADPRFEMDPNERWMAAVHGVHPQYSALMRHGIGEVLILLALHGDRAYLVRDPTRRVDAIVHGLLDQADPERWWSLSREFRLLAEASPPRFLSAIERSLDHEDPPIRALFGPGDDDPLFSTEHLSDLLWALESLAWSPDLMPRVSHILARLDAIDDPSGRYSNRPANSLRSIHLLWQPQTFTPLQERLRALDLIRKHEPDAAWKLMLGILPQGQDSVTPSPLPRWRDYTSDNVETITYGLVGEGAAAVSTRLLDDAGLARARWEQLLERLGDIVPDHVEALSALERTEPRITDKADRDALWEELRRILHHHRSYADAGWALAQEVLDQLELIYDRLAPADPLERVAWLFDSSAAVPNPSQTGWEAAQRDLATARIQAATAVHTEHGMEGTRALAALVEAPGLIGQALYEGGLHGDALTGLIESALRNESPNEKALAHGLIVSASRNQGRSWSEALLAMARAGSWDDAALLDILSALPSEQWTWDQAARLGSDIEGLYWRRASTLWMGEDCDETAFAIRKLIAAGRARHAVALADRRGKGRLPSELLVEMLQKAVEEPFDVENDAEGNSRTMLQHYISEIFQTLDQREDAPPATLVQLEWSYLPLLANSRRRVKVLMTALAEEPELFVQMLNAAYKPTDEGSTPDPDPDPGHAQALGRQAHKLLDLWNRLPGTQDDGSIDAAALEEWVKQARSLAGNEKRKLAADHRIGRLLSASPIGVDENWPHEAVRHVLDLFHSKTMTESFVIGKQNRRGITSRRPGAGGELEREEAKTYREWARSISAEHPRTAQALNDIAESYEHLGRRHDEDAERFDWGQ